MTSRLNLPSQAARPDVSVIIPFRNREILRLRRAIESLKLASDGLSIEIIVSDYGSDAELDVPGLCEQTGARHVLTPATNWSRAACLNRGIDVARGRLIQTNDADMLWAPGALTVHALPMLQDLRYIVSYQVWDLPEKWTEPIIQGSNWSWDQLRSDATSHSRWGHGLLLMPASAARAVRGFDERMHTYGVEDLDMTQRIRRAGYPQRWAGHHGDELFHIWHPSTSLQARTDPQVRTIVDRNKRYYREDLSVIRNLDTGHYPKKNTYAQPLVTVAISTRNRALYLAEAIKSVQAQTFQDFEIVVVDDGSTDRTREVVNEIDDPRIHYYYQEQSGISAARNSALQHSRGLYTAVLDDDDLMVFDRLAVQLQGIREGIQGVVGNFVNFREETGELTSWADNDPTLGGAYRTGGFAGHPTWLVETSVLRALRYEESLSSSVDNNIALRALRSGVVFRHCDEVVTLRRLHAGQVSQQDATNQQSGSRLMHGWLNFTVIPGKRTEITKKHSTPLTNTRKTGLHDLRILASLPDYMVTRVATVSANSMDGAEILLERENGCDPIVAEKDGIIYAAQDIDHNMTLESIARCRKMGLEVRIESAVMKNLSVNNAFKSAQVNDLKAEQKISLNSRHLLVEGIREQQVRALAPGQYLLEVLQSFSKIEEMEAHKWNIRTSSCDWNVFWALLKDRHDLVRLLKRISCGFRVFDTNGLLSLSDMISHNLTNFEKLDEVIS